MKDFTATMDVITREVSPLSLVLDRLDGVQPSGPGFRAVCPAHQGRNRNLAIHEGRDAVLLKCFVGCSFQEIINALGVSASDLFFRITARSSHETKGRRPQPPPRPYRWPWRQQLNELQAIASVRGVRSEEFLRSVSLAFFESLPINRQGQIWQMIITAHQWLQVEEQTEKLVFHLRQRIRAQEAHHV